MKEKYISRIGRGGGYRLSPRSDHQILKFSCSSRGEPTKSERAHGKTLENEMI